MQNYSTKRKKLSPVVAAMGKIPIEGNIIPHRWYTHPRLKSTTKLTNLAAIHVLANLVYWYRPVTERDEVTQEIVAVRNKFSGEKLRVDYDKWAVHLGLTKRQIQDAVAFLKQQKIIEHEFHAVWKTTDGTAYYNVLFLSPIPSAISEISDPSSDVAGEEGVTEKRETIPDDHGSVPPPTEKGETCSEITGEGSTEKRDAYPVKKCASMEIQKETSSEISMESTTTDHAPAGVPDDMPVSCEQGVVGFLYENDSNPVENGTPAENTPTASRFSVSESVVEARLEKLKGGMLSDELNNPLQIKAAIAESLSVLGNDPAGKSETQIKTPKQVVPVTQRVVASSAIKTPVISVTQSRTASSAIKPDDLTARLIEIGIKRDEASAFIANYDTAEIENQIAYLPYQTIRTTPARFLAAAIKHEYDAPKAYTAAQKATTEAREKAIDDARAAMEIAEIQRRKVVERAAREAEAQAKSAREAEVGAVLSRLSPGQANALEQAVWAELSHTPGPVGTAGAAVRDKRKSADEALAGRLVRVAYDRARSHMVSEWASKGGSLRG